MRTESEGLKESVGKGVGQIERKAKSWDQHARK